MSGHVQERGQGLFQEGGASIGWPILLALLGIGLALLLSVRPLVAVGVTVAGLAAAHIATRPLVGLVMILAVVALLGSDSILKIQAGIQWVEVDLILMIAALGWMVRWVVSGFGRSFSRLDLVMILFGAIIVIGTHRGLSEGIALTDLRSELRPPAYLILVYAISRATLGEVGKIRWVFRMLLVISTLAAIKALIVFLTVPLGAPGGEEQVVWATRVMNSDGFKRVIVHGAETFPVLMGLYVFPTLVASRARRRRILGWALVSLFVLVVMISMTRSYWIGFLAGLVCLLALERPHVSLRMIAEMTGAGAILIALLALLQNQLIGLPLLDLADQIGNRLAGSATVGWDPSAAARMAEFDAIRTVLAQSPWTGVGIGGTYSFYSGVGGGVMEWEYTHNSYAYWALKLGFPGLVVVLGLLTLGLMAAVRWVHIAPTYRERSLAAGLLAGVVALCAISLTSPWLTHYVGAAWTGLVFGCSETMRLRREQARGEKAP